LLVGVLGASLLIVSPVAFWHHGLRGFLEAGVAALICLLSGVAALGVAWRCVRAGQPLLGMLLAMAIRLILPLMVCLLLSLRGMGADSLGFICYLLTFYLVNLAVETYLSIQGIPTTVVHCEVGLRTSK